MDASIDELDLSVNTYNRLHWSGVKTIADLIGKSERELLSKPLISQTEVREVKQRLAQKNLRLRREE